jgi:multidrug efflux system membrane fusion protein
MEMNMRKVLLAGTVAVAIAAVTLVATHDVPWFVGGGGAGAATPPAMPAMPVPVTKVIRKTIPVYLDYAARTEAIQSVTLQAKIPGYVAAQIAKDGADVKAGDLLYRIDPRDYQAVLDQMKAQGERDVAALDYAQANLDRGMELARSGYIAKDSLEQRMNTLHQAQAAVGMDKATIHTAEINLSYAEIRAPFAGRLGRNQAPVGTLITVGNTTLNTLVQLDPIYVTFNPSETDLAAITAARAKGPLQADILLPGETEPSHHGTLTFLDNTVDHATGTIAARATIPNGDFSLLPGQYVRVRLHLREDPDALMVPQAALGSNQLGKYVYVVGKGDTAEQRLVTLGPMDGALVAVLKGVAESDRVIDGNLQKIGPGAPVKPLPHETD